jgi:hypothetical protein
MSLGANMPDHVQKMDSTLHILHRNVRNMPKLTQRRRLASGLWSTKSTSGILSRLFPNIAYAFNFWVAVAHHYVSLRQLAAVNTDSYPSQCTSDVVIGSWHKFFEPCEKGVLLLGLLLQIPLLIRHTFLRR